MWKQQLPYPFYMWKAWCRAHGTTPAAHVVVYLWAHLTVAGQRSGSQMLQLLLHLLPYLLWLLGPVWISSRASTGHSIIKVGVSKRLTQSPVCLCGFLCIFADSSLFLLPNCFLANFRPQHEKHKQQA